MRYLLHRLGFFVLTLWAAITVNFFIPRLMPGDPASAMMSRFHGRLNPTAIHAMEVAFGVDTSGSVWSQYLTYLHNTVTGNFGTSLTYFPLSVSSQIAQALPWTLGLIGVATVPTRVPPRKASTVATPMSPRVQGRAWAIWLLTDSGK